MDLANAQPIPDPLLEQADFSVPAGLKAELDEVITHYPNKRSASMMLLHGLQERFGFISRQAVEWVAERLQLQPIHVYELVSFYPMFQRKPLGRHHVRVCRTLSCALAGSGALHRQLCGKLGLDASVHGPQTTADGKYTVEFVECLASCGTGPVMMCNDAFHEQVSAERAEQILAECK